MQVAASTSDFLSPDELPAVEVINAGGQSRVVLICEHASNYIPRALNHLGLDREGQVSHAAWDIGARDVALALSASLDAPLAASRISRLVYDCNRPPEAPTAIPAASELIDVPGNHDLSDHDRQLRIEAVYRPFQQTVQEMIGQKIKLGQAPVVITLHSFTPVYFGQPRATELGLLHDRDDRLALRMLEVAIKRGTFRTELNAPYAASDGVTHTLREHAVAAGLENVMIEIRNDLISNPAGIDMIARELHEIIAEVLT